MSNTVSSRLLQISIETHTPRLGHHSFLVGHNNRRNDILNLPEFVLNPLQERLLDIFPNNEGRINFRLFCRGLAVFHPDASPSTKLQCLPFPLSHLTSHLHKNTLGTTHITPTDTVLFQLYDVDGDGLVSVGDVENLLRSAAGESLTEEEVHKLAVSGLDNQDSVDYQGFALVCTFNACTHLCGRVICCCCQRHI